MRTLDAICPLLVVVAGVRVTPLGPTHWKLGLVTPLGRVTEQLRMTVAPAMTGEEGEEVTEMEPDSREKVNHQQGAFDNIIVSASRYL